MTGCYSFNNRDTGHFFPLALVWYLNIGGIYAAIKETRAKKVARVKDYKTEVTAK